MGLLDDADLSKLKLNRMIFHVIGPKPEDLNLMDEVNAAGFEPFFLERVRETNIGHRFNFIGEEQGIKPTLSAMVSRPNDFVELSKNLAEAFHGLHAAVNGSRGAFIVAKMGGLETDVFALIKLDDMQVLRFSQEKTAQGKVRATVSEVGNTFVEDRKAMQKCALVVLGRGGGGSLAVYDRTNRRNISDYFTSFLGAKRTYDAPQATERLRKALTSAFEQNKASAPEEVRRTWRSRLRTESESREVIDPEKDLDAFGASVFGPFWTNPNFQQSLKRSFQTQKIAGEVIEIDLAQIPIPKNRRIKTIEDILIVYPRDLDKAAQAVVRVDREPSGAAVITIRTKGIVDNDELAESADPRI